MTTEEISPAEEVQTILSEIIALDIERDLVRTTDLGKDANFAASRSLFEKVINYAHRLETLNWSLLPDASLHEVLSRLSALWEILDQIKQFSLPGGDPIVRRDSLAAALGTRFDELLTSTIPYVGFLSWETINLTEKQKQIDELLKDAQMRITDLTQNAQRELGGSREEAKRILDAMKEASAEAGVAVHAEVFREVAKQMERRSWWWLIASIIVALSTIIVTVALVFLWEVNGDISEASVLQVVLAKGIVVTIGFLITLNFFRLFRSHVHLAVINQHRDKSLRTFRAFSEAAVDEETKGKVLLEATHAIFGHTPSGLVEGRDTGVVELLDGATGLVRRSS